MCGMAFFPICLSTMCATTSIELDHTGGMFRNAGPPQHGHCADHDRVDMFNDILYRMLHVAVLPAETE